MMQRLRMSLSPLHKLLNGGAWFFLTMSLLMMGWVVISKMADPSNTVALYSVTAQGQTYDAWGLTYPGVPGLIQAFFQIGIVLAAASATLLKPSGPRAIKCRRLGHTVLTLWAGWWAINLIRLAGMSEQVGTLAQSSFMTLLFAATGYRALSGWWSSTTETAQEKECLETVETVEQIKMEEVFGPQLQAEEPEASDPNQPPKLMKRLWDQFQKLTGKNKAEKVKVKANQFAVKARSSIAKAGREVSKRAKPVGQTMVREGKRAFHKTIKAMKDGEMSNTNTADVKASPSSTEHVA